MLAISNRNYQVKYTIFDAKLSETVNIDIAYKKQLKVIKVIIAKKLNVNSKQIISVNRLFGKIKSDIKDNDISLLLISLNSAALSGNNLVIILISTINDLYSNKKLNQRLSIYKKLNLTLAQILSRLNIDAVVLALIEAGESAGRLSDFLQEAENYLNVKKNAKKAAQTNVMKSFFYGITGMLIILAMPVFFAPIFNEIIESLKKEPTDIVFYINYINDNISLILLIITLVTLVVIISIANNTIYQAVKKLPFYNLFYNLSSLKKALVFVPFYSTLNIAGVRDNVIAKLYAKVDNNISQALIKSINKNETLTKAMSRTDLPVNFLKNMSVTLEISDIQARMQAFKGIIDLLKSQIQHAGKKISTILSIIGFTLIMVGIVIMLMIYLSMITIAM